MAVLRQKVWNDWGSLQSEVENLKEQEYLGVVEQANWTRRQYREIDERHHSVLLPLSVAVLVSQLLEIPVLILQTQRGKQFPLSYWLQE